MIDLRCATLVMPIYNRSHEDLNQTIRVMRYMRSVAHFYTAILFTACEMERNSPSEVVQIPEMDIRGLQAFQITVMPRFIQTPFVMICHNDGFIIQPELWSTEFLKYDFIGAPWGDGVVGNDGFSLQSQKMLWAKSQIGWIDTGQGDELACRIHRETMRDHGVRFAPFEVAARFATETTGNEYPSLGFHGKSASQAKHKKGWETIAAFEAGDAPAAPDPTPT